MGIEYTFGDITVACTNTDRIVFPESGITKGEIIAYYHSVADAMLPELRGRPLTLERFTKGIAAGGFFQKHAQKHFPAWIDRVTLGTKTVVEYPICDTAAGLVYFANQGAIALHVWTSRKASRSPAPAGSLGPDHPDLLVFDLDPPDGRFDLVRRAAPIIRGVLGELELPAFVKTTGGKGLHVVAPLDGVATFHEVTELANQLAVVLCARHPDLLTTEFYKKDRKGRLFLDMMRNAAGATFIAPYSLRGRPGAPVSAPIEWAELDDPELAPDGFKLRDIKLRLPRDPWRDLRAQPGSIAAAAKLVPKR